VYELIDIMDSTFSCHVGEKIIYRPTQCSPIVICQLDTNFSDIAKKLVTFLNAVDVDGSLVKAVVSKDRFLIKF
jgi:hypothetical protein